MALTSCFFINKNCSFFFKISTVSNFICADRILKTYCTFSSASLVSSPHNENAVSDSAFFNKYYYSAFKQLKRTYISLIHTKKCLLTNNVCAIKYFRKLDSRNISKAMTEGEHAYWAKETKSDKKNTYDEQQINEWKNKFCNLQVYGDDDVREWRKAFEKFDRDEDGFISQADLQKASHFTLEKSKFFKEYDADKNNLIDFGEFVEAMWDVDVKTLKSSFEDFDQVDVKLEFDKLAITDTSINKKLINIEIIKKLMKTHGFTCITDCDANKLFGDFDVDKNGEIDFEDFKNWLSKK